MILFDIEMPALVVRSQSLRTSISTSQHRTKGPEIGSITTKSMANVYWTEIFILRDKKSTTMKIFVGFVCMRACDRAFRWKLWIIFSMGKSVETMEAEENK